MLQIRGNKMFSVNRPTRFRSTKWNDVKNKLNEEDELRKLIRKEINNILSEGEDLEEYYDESEISEDEMLYDAEQISEEEEELEESEDDEIEESITPRRFNRRRNRF
jgi:hypothetical protein